MRFACSRPQAPPSTTSRRVTSGWISFERAPSGRICEWKGAATYHSLVLPSREIPDIAWSYPEPNAGYEEIRDHLAFYAWKVDEAWVGDERATPQPGHFYGGWVTSRVVGPFKGGPGTAGW